MAETQTGSCTIQVLQLICADVSVSHSCPLLTGECSFLRTPHLKQECFQGFAAARSLMFSDLKVPFPRGGVRWMNQVCYDVNVCSGINISIWPLSSVFIYKVMLPQCVLWSGSFIVHLWHCRLQKAQKLYDVSDGQPRPPGTNGHAIWKSVRYQLNSTLSSYVTYNTSVDVKLLLCTSCYALTHI